MKTVFTILVLLALNTTTTHADVWRVDNNPVAGADFLSVQDAINSASVANGDTLYVAGSASVYGAIGLTKQLFIFGPGYFLGENPDTPVDNLSARVGTLTFSAGSEGSLVSGLAIEAVVIDVDNITLLRNSILTYFATGLVRINGGHSNILIAQNYIHNIRSTNTSNAIDILGASINVVISNNLLETTSSSARAINGASSASVQLLNNVLIWNIVLSNSVLRNNILRGGSFTGSNNTVEHNLGGNTPFGTDNGNQGGIEMSTVFVGAAGNSTDGQWQLLAGSPAIGAGVGGEDVGMFGGSDPYVLSGLPPLPVIYFLSAPLTVFGNTGLPVQIKVRSNN